MFYEGLTRDLTKTVNDFKAKDIDLFRLVLLIVPILYNNHFSLYVVANPGLIEKIKNTTDSRGGYYSPFPG